MFLSYVNTDFFWGGAIFRTVEVMETAKYPLKISKKTHFYLTSNISKMSKEYNYTPKKFPKCSIKLSHTNVQKLGPPTDSPSHHPISNEWSSGAFLS